MTKHEMIKEYQRLLEEKRMYGIDGIGTNSRKDEIQNAIDCLKATDEEMQDFLTVFKLKYKNMYNTIMKSNYLTHNHNRLYVYNTARQILA